jgi:uncharacterized protein
MKTLKFFLLAILIVSMIGCSIVKPTPGDNKIVVGTIESLYSKILNEERKLWVYIPVQDPLYAKQSFPVVYLLDGDAHFYSVMGIIQQLSEVNMNMVLPKMILIGITNTNRTRDLTPTKENPEDINSGGGEIFTAFIEKELIPYVDSKYPTLPYRILIGHSYGGLLCVNTLINHTKLFTGYIAIDPSMQWDNMKLLNRAKEELEENKFQGTSFYLSIANQGFSDTDSIKDNAAAFNLAGYLDANKQNGLRYQWHYYMEDNHGSVPLISEYDGLRFLLDFYNPRLPYTKFRDPAYKVDSFLIEHYSDVSRNMGFEVAPPESLLNWLGYLFIMEKQYDKSYKLFKMNIENYTESANAFDSIGEIELIMGDTLQSLKHYEKSLELNPKNKNAENIINNLKH